MSARVYVCPVEKEGELKKMLEYDPYLDPKIKEEDLKKIREDEMANIIFARQDYVIKEGASISLDPSKCYLFLNAQDSFLDKAEKKLKNIEGLKRAEPDIESKVIMLVEDERRKADEGFGSIFG
ncbi:MAG: hypothetical protein ACP5P2_02350 [Candidatus Micrarchaeia archaeon]|jgi:hypothetical protein